MNPQPLLQLDRVIHEKGRLGIMSALAASPRMSFRELRELLEMTDGNLTAHVRTLHEAGYIAVIKEVDAGRPITSYSLTQTGRTAFSGYLKLLAQVIHEASQSMT